MAFCTRSRDVVIRPFSVTSDMPPLGESKFITYLKSFGCHHLLFVVNMKREKGREGEREIGKKKQHSLLLFAVKTLAAHRNKLKQQQTLQKDEHS